jgi:hypothetical protein
MAKKDDKITPMIDDRKLPDGVISVAEADHPEEEWFKSAYDQTVETLPEFVNHLMNDYCHDYGTVCHAIAACAMAAIHAADNTELNGGITVFQASFVMWDIVKQMCFRGNEVGLKIIDYDDMLYPQYEHKFNKTISLDRFERLQEVAQKNLDEMSGCAEVRQHWQSIVDGKIPFGYTIGED